VSRFRKLICVGRSGNKTDPNFDDDVHWETTVFKTAGLVANDTAGIGYTGFAYIDSGVKVLALAPNSTASPVPGTYEKVAKAEYPLSRVFYFNLNKAPGKAWDPVLKELLLFVLSKERQQLILDQGVFLPLREFQQKSSLDRIASAP
jgi:phosphate transport system substrate-binding protein